MQPRNDDIIFAYLTLCLWPSVMINLVLVVLPLGIAADLFHTAASLDCAVCCA